MSITPAGSGSPRPCGPRDDGICGSPLPRGPRDDASPSLRGGEADAAIQRFSKTLDRHGPAGLAMTVRASLRTPGSPRPWGPRDGGSPSLRGGEADAAIQHSPRPLAGAPVRGRKGSGERATPSIAPGTVPLALKRTKPVGRQHLADIMLGGMVIPPYGNCPTGLAMTLRRHCEEAKPSPQPRFAPHGLGCTPARLRQRKACFAKPCLRPRGRGGERRAQTDSTRKSSALPGHGQIPQPVPCEPLDRHGPAGLAMTEFVDRPCPTVLAMTLRRHCEEAKPTRQSSTPLAHLREPPFGDTRGLEWALSFVTQFCHSR
jgi:hypothetical protein